MPSQIEIRRGYVRAEADVFLLDSATEAASEERGCGYLDLLTDEGPLRLKVNYHSAEGLMMSLERLMEAMTSLAFPKDVSH